MNGLFAALGVIAGGVIGFLLGKKSGTHPSLLGGGVSDSSLFRTVAGTGGFCEGRVVKYRMTGRHFEWKRVGGCSPAPGSRFEIRLKNSAIASPLIPATPAGVDLIRAGVRDSERPGTVYEYSLYQVLANGSERELDDPELEIGQI
jgi:hypothetical protein